MANNPEQLASERRIYIHRETFGHLARTDPAIANRVSHALMYVRLAKVMRHHLEQVDELGVLRPAVKLGLEAPVRQARHESLASLLGAVGYKPKIPYLPGPARPVLTVGESVVDTCFQDGYYTFATGLGAAERMFDDQVPIPELTRSIASGVGSDTGVDVSDLTIIRGRNLFPLPDLAAPTGCSLEEVQEIDKDARQVRRRIDGLVRYVGERTDGFTADESVAIEGLRHAVFRTLETASI